MDINILYFIQENLRNDILDNFFCFITRLGDKGVFWIILGIILLAFSKTRKMGVCILLALAFSAILGEGILKPLFARKRPFVTYPGIDLIISKPSGFSLPSGHTMSSFSAASVIFLNNKRYGIFAYILATLIAFSRLYLFVHYPSDVILGIILGCLVGYLVKKAVSKEE